MDRTQQLADIYRKSGLDKVLVANGQRYVEQQRFSKLKFVRSDFRIRSIELWDHKSGITVFRIHHSDAAPDWLPEAMRGWPQVRMAAKFGTSFDGNPLKPAKALAKLLASKQRAATRRLRGTRRTPCE
jgi:hypothetical protein